MSEMLEQLKEEATELGIKFNPNIGEAKLQEKIDAYYEGQESSGKEILEAVVAKEKSEEKPAVAGKVAEMPMHVRARHLYDKAKATKVVTIIDNDQRVNNQTTTCKANWTNAFYDLGTRIFPLNTPIEIPQGFIDVLKGVLIPHHTKDPKTGLSVTTMRPRYTIQIENFKPEQA